MNYAKPESALKRAAELLEVEQPDAALDVLHQAVMTRRFRTNWADVSKELILKHFELGIKLRKLRRFCLDFEGED